MKAYLMVHWREETLMAVVEVFQDRVSSTL